MKRMQFCFNCGAELGVYQHEPGDIESCGSAECEREARAERRAEMEHRMLDAAEDNYERYR